MVLGSRSCLAPLAQLVFHSHRVLPRPRQLVGHTGFRRTDIPITAHETALPSSRVVNCARGRTPSLPRPGPERGSTDSQGQQWPPAAIDHASIGRDGPANVFRTQIDALVARLTRTSFSASRDGSLKARSRRAFDRPLTRTKG